MKTFTELLDEFRDSIYENGWDSAMSQERGGFSFAYNEAEDTLYAEILARVADLENRLAIFVKGVGDMEKAKNEAQTEVKRLTDELLRLHKQVGDAIHIP